MTLVKKTIKVKAPATPKPKPKPAPKVEPKPKPKPEPKPVTLPKPQPASPNDPHAGHTIQPSAEPKTVAVAGQTQDNADKVRLFQILQSYYGIKDALVADNRGAASANALAFIRNINGISYQVISEGNIDALVKDASVIADAKDVATQRRYFVNFSSNMVEVAKALPMSASPVYVQYCPMKDASWLSNDKAIRNPYYGCEMLTCGEVTNTIE